MESFKSKKPKDQQVEQITKEALRKRLHLYHQTTKEKWEKIKKIGAILSEKELLLRGLITADQLEDFETTSTGSLDREVGRDNFIFASHQLSGYGEVTLEIDLSALDIPNAKVATAGDWLHFAVEEEDKKYFLASEIPASEFIDYLVNFLSTLPDQEWFWGKDDPRILNLIGEGMIDKTKGNPEKIRSFWRLRPEIMFPKELPLSYVKNISIK